MDFIYLAEERDLVNTVMNIRVRLKQGNFLTTLASISSRKLQSNIILSQHNFTSLISNFLLLIDHISRCIVHYPEALHIRYININSEYTFLYLTWPITKSCIAFVEMNPWCILKNNLSIILEMKCKTLLQLNTISKHILLFMLIYLTCEASGSCTIHRKV
jgi:hypothetical protein